MPWGTVKYKSLNVTPPRRSPDRPLAMTIDDIAVYRDLCGETSRCAFPDFGDWSYDSRVRRLGLSLRRLLPVIERMYRLNLSIYDVNAVKNVNHSINSLHIEKGCDVISLDYVLL
jgi:hypothetical protein